MNSASGVSIFQREILYTAYSVHANPFESDSAAEFGFKNLAIRPSSRTARCTDRRRWLQFHRRASRAEGGEERNGARHAVVLSVEKRWLAKYAYKREPKVADADC